MGRWTPIAEALGITREQSKRDASEFRRAKKNRFLADENIESDVLRILKTWKIDVKSAKDFGLCGKSDEQLYGVAWKKRRIIISYDDGFLDDKRFPLNICAGVIILPPYRKSRDAFIHAAYRTLKVFGTGGDVWLHSKIKVDGSARAIVRSWMKEDGQVSTTSYWLKFGNALVYVEDE